MAGRARHKRPARPTLPPMTTPLSRYRLEAKADFPDPATEPDPADAGPDLSQDPSEDGLEWAGDLYEEGDESDPAEAFAVFQGEGDLHAWLDRADDGTLTGWVADVDGSVYRYSDVDAWAIDVRDAGMSRTDDAEALPGAGEDDPEGEVEDGEEDPDADGDAEGPDADEDGDGEEGEDLFEQDMSGDALPDDEAADDEADPDADGDDDTDPATDDDEDGEDFFAKQKRKGEGKSYSIEFRPFGAQR